MSRPLTASLVALLAVTACERPGDPARARALAARALKGTLAYPQSALVSAQAGEDAAQAVFTTGAPLRDVAEWYRQNLVLNGWELQSDAVAKDGEITIYAEKDKRPLWVRLRTNAGRPGTTYTLIGAIAAPDTVR